MLEDRFLKRLRKKARKGLRRWPMATIAVYDPDLSQATKVGIRQGSGLAARSSPFSPS